RAGGRALAHATAARTAGATAAEQHPTVAAVARRTDPGRTPGPPGAAAPEELTRLSWLAP
ncbi:MAG: hypothetical protein ACO396_04800, partial [Phycisphaerales bacterium]